MNIIERVVTEHGMSVRDIFETAYREDKEADYGNVHWARDLYKRSGIVTRTVERWCEKKIEGHQLPLDFPDYCDRFGFIK